MVGITRLVLSADILSVSSSSFALKRANDKKLSFWNSLRRLIYINTSVDNTNWWFSLLCNQNLNQNCWMPDTKRVSYCRIFIKNYLPKFRSVGFSVVRNDSNFTLENPTTLKPFQKVNFTRSFIFWRLNCYSRCFFGFWIFLTSHENQGFIKEVYHTHQVGWITATQMNSLDYIRRCNSVKTSWKLINSIIQSLIRKSH